MKCFRCNQDEEVVGYEKTAMGTDWHQFPIERCMNPRCERFNK